MPRLLLVHHTPSPNLQAVLEAVREGVAMVEDVELVVRPALSAGAADLLEADGVLLGTPANIGYMSGALKHFFDTVYYPCLEAKIGMPYGVYVHGQNDTTGAIHSIEKATTAPRSPSGRSGPTVESRPVCFSVSALTAAPTMTRKTVVHSQNMLIATPESEP